MVFSNYNYKIKFGSGNQTFELGSQIQDWNFSEQFDYYANANNTMSFGVNVIHHTFKPGEIETGDGIDFVLNDIENTYALESAAYIQNEQKIGKRFSMIYGLRYSNFAQLGPGDIFTFDSEGDAIDTTTYKLTKFLVPMLSPITKNEYTVSDSFLFANEIQEQDAQLYMASLDVDSLFTNIPLSETIEICVNNLFSDCESLEGLSKEDFVNYYL